MKKLISKIGKNKENIPKRKLSLLTKLFILADIVIVGCFVFVYGPSDYAKVTWITTAMTTANHRYLANIFYSENTISEVMAENTIIEVDEDTNVNDIVVGGDVDIKSYASTYEKQILEHNPEDPYKLIKLKHGEFDVYLVAIYDPTRIQAAYATPIGRGQIVSDISKNNNAIVAINGGGYSWANGRPLGVVIHNGKLISSSDYKAHVTAGFNKDGVLIIGRMNASDAAKKNLKEALSFGPVLIANGKATQFKGNGGSGQNPRTAIAQRRDGVVLFMVVDGYSKGLSWKGRGGVYYQDMINILQKYGAYNAVNMDGGSSSTLVINNRLVNNPCEPQKEGQDFVRSAWILK